MKGNTYGSAVISMLQCTCWQMWTFLVLCRCEAFLWDGAQRCRGRAKSGTG